MTHTAGNPLLQHSLCPSALLCSPLPAQPCPRRGGRGTCGRDAGMRGCGAAGWPAALTWAEAGSEGRSRLTCGEGSRGGAAGEPPPEGRPGPAPPGSGQRSAGTRRWPRGEVQRIAPKLRESMARWAWHAGWLKDRGLSLSLQPH